MKKNRNSFNKSAAGWGIAIALTFLLILLTSAESSNPNATIRTPWDALWYFISTITTVGYGDVSPVTPLGKLLGVIFILLSCGFISVLVTAAIHFVNGSTILRIRIALARADKWYIFGEYEPEGACLAAKLWNLPENSGIIFCGTEHQVRGLLRLRYIFTPLSVYDMIQICRKELGGKSGFENSVFLMNDDEELNLQAALELPSLMTAASPMQVYCRTGIRFQTPPEGVHTFDPADIAARAYWAENPLSTDEKNVVLIGSDGLLDCLAEQAILVNVFGPLLRANYHIFSVDRQADSPDGRERFLDSHPHIKDTLPVFIVNGDANVAAAAQQSAPNVILSEAKDLNEAKDPNDTLLFHTEPWEASSSCLERADRIIICTSSEIENIRIAEKIRCLYATKARFYICGTDSIDGVVGFGSPDSIYTPEEIIREEQLRRARTLNDYYNSLQEDESKRTRWEDLTMFARRSNMAAADHMGTKLRILTGNLDKNTAVIPDPITTAYAIRNFKGNVIDRQLLRQIEHERWMRFHSMYGWTYGETRDNTLRRHPLMVPFESLTPQQQAMDDISWELLTTLR